MAINLANGRRLLTRHEGYSQEFADRFSLSGLGVFFFKRSNVFKHLFQANFLRRFTINMVRFLRGDFPLKPPPPPGYTHTYTTHPPPPHDNIILSSWHALQPSKPNIISILCVSVYVDTVKPPFAVPKTIAACTNSIITSREILRHNT